MGGGAIRLFGDRNATDAVSRGLTRLYPRLWRYCQVLTGSEHAAAILAKAVHERAVEQANEVVPGPDFDKWVFRLAYRLWVNEVRCQVAQQLGGATVSDDITAPKEKDGCERRTEGAIVNHMINKLPEAQRICVLLVYGEGMKYVEVADILDIPVGTILRRLTDARRMMATDLAKSKLGAG